MNKISTLERLQAAFETVLNKDRNVILYYIRTEPDDFGTQMFKHFEHNYAGCPHTNIDRKKTKATLFSINQRQSGCNPYVKGHHTTQTFVNGMLSTKRANPKISANEINKILSLTFD